MGYAGLFSTGIVGSVALGGLAVVLVSGKPVPEGWAAGGPRIVSALLFAALAIALAVWLYRKLKPGAARALALALFLLAAFFMTAASSTPPCWRSRRTIPHRPGISAGWG